MNKFVYKTGRLVAKAIDSIYLKTKVIRNELDGHEGSALILSNHEMSLDFIALYAKVKRPINFVISQSFYNTLPIQGLLDKIDAIPKQQFKTTRSSLVKMKNVIKNGGLLSLFPAGLMTEDGLSTTIPESTAKFIKWLDADVFFARNYKTYFINPKWSKGLKKTHTKLDIYKGISREELKTLSDDEITKRMKDALDFNAYKEMEEDKTIVKGINNLSGLEGVLYKCPKCHKDFSIKTFDNKIYCDSCGYEEYSDEYGILHQENEGDIVFKYPYEWSKYIKDSLEKEVDINTLNMEFNTSIQTLNSKKHKYETNGKGKVIITKEEIKLIGTINNIETELSFSLYNVPLLPFKPGVHIELQDQLNSYRLILDEPLNVMKIINLIKIIYEKGVNNERNS